MGEDKVPKEPKSQDSEQTTYIRRFKKSVSLSSKKVVIINSLKILFTIIVRKVLQSVNTQESESQNGYHNVGVKW